MTEQAIVPGDLLAAMAVLGATIGLYLIFLSTSLTKWAWCLAIPVLLYVLFKAWDYRVSSDLDRHGYGMLALVLMLWPIAIGTTTALMIFIVGRFAGLRSGIARAGIGLLGLLVAAWPASWIVLDN